MVKREFVRSHLKKSAALLMAIAMAVSGCAISEPGQDDRETSAAVISEDNRVIKKEEIKTIDSGREDKLKKAYLRAHYISHKPQCFDLRHCGCFLRLPFMQVNLPFAQGVLKSLNDYAMVIYAEMMNGRDHIC